MGKNLKFINLQLWLLDGSENLLYSISLPIYEDIDERFNNDTLKKILERLIGWIDSSAYT